jgi:hypothetical protein
MDREELKRLTLRDLDWLERLVIDYRGGILGQPCGHTLQDIELVVKDMRQRFDQANGILEDTVA